MTITDIVPTIKITSLTTLRRLLAEDGVTIKLIKSEVIDPDGKITSIAELTLGQLNIVISHHFDHVILQNGVVLDFGPTYNWVFNGDVAAVIQLGGISRLTYRINRA